MIFYDSGTVGIFEVFDLLFRQFSANLSDGCSGVFDEILTRCLTRFFAVVLIRIWGRGKNSEQS